MSSATYEKSFAQVPLNDPAFVDPGADAPKSALTPYLEPGGDSRFCIWADPRADVTFLSIAVETIVRAEGLTIADSLAAKGYTCTRESEGSLCAKVGTDATYGVATGDTYFIRGNTGIRIRQANFPSSDLMSEVEDRVFDSGASASSGASPRPSDSPAEPPATGGPVVR